MSAADRQAASPYRPARRQRGTAAVEFALLAWIFFTAVFGIIEVARMLYVYNTLQEVTRRAAAAAAHVYPTDSAGIAHLKTQAVFRNTPGELPLASPVSDAHVRIDYLALTREPVSEALSLTEIAPAALPDSAARNRQLCMANPNAANCIRFVQVRVCDNPTGGDCTAVRSRMMLPMIDLRVPLHMATTIVPVESFGYLPGDSPCPCP